jgi:hypothetical protein
VKATDRLAADRPTLLLRAYAVSTDFDKEEPMSTELLRASEAAQILDKEPSQARPRAEDLYLSVVGTGVDPVTSRFSGARSTN